MLNILKDDDLDNNDVILLEENSCEFIRIIDMNRDWYKPDWD